MEVRRCHPPTSQPFMLGIAFYNPVRHLQVEWNGVEFEIDDRLNLSSGAYDLGDVRSHGAACKIRLIEGAEIELENHGKTIVLSDGQCLQERQTIRRSLPVLFRVGDTQFEVVATDVFDDSDTSLARLDSMINETSDGSRISPGPETLHAWLDALGQLQTSVAGSRDFFAAAARAVHNPGGLDGGLVLQRRRRAGRLLAASCSTLRRGFLFERVSCNDVFKRPRLFSTLPIRSSPRITISTGPSSARYSTRPAR